MLAKQAWTHHWTHKIEQRQARVCPALHQSTPLAIQPQSSMLSCIMDEALCGGICISVMRQETGNIHTHSNAIHIREVSLAIIAT